MSTQYIFDRQPGEGEGASTSSYRRTNLFPHVNAKGGAEIISYEDDTGELPVRMLICYSRLVDLPLENLVDDDRDLWFGHRVD